MDDVAVIITSMAEAHWLERALPTLLAHLGDVRADVVVVDIDDDLEGDPDTAKLLREHHPSVRRLITRNGGFAHANNVGLRSCDARYYLLLNPDTEWVAGDVADLVAHMDRDPSIGTIGVRQLTGDGTVYPTMRRFASVRRRVAEALYLQRLDPRFSHAVFDPALYDREQRCDWTVGSFLLCRREALEAAGLLDERFFFCSEEEELCWRIRRAGWVSLYVPYVTIVHHVGKRGVQPRFVAQQAYAARQLMAKRERRGRRLAWAATQTLYFGLRGLSFGVQARLTGSADAAVKAQAATAGLKAAVGIGAAPFREPPPRALPPREQAPLTGHARVPS